MWDQLRANQCLSLRNTRDSSELSGFGHTDETSFVGLYCRWRDYHCFILQKCCISLRDLKNISFSNFFSTQLLDWAIVTIKGFIQFSHTLLQTFKAISALARTPGVWFITSRKEKGTFRSRRHDFYLHPSLSCQRGLKSKIMTYSNGMDNVRQFIRLWETVKPTFSCALSIVISNFNYSNYSFSRLSLQDSRINALKYKKNFSPNFLPKPASRETRCNSLSSIETLQTEYWRTFVKTIRGALGGLLDSEHQQTFRQHFLPPQKSAWFFSLTLLATFFIITNTRWNKQLFSVNISEAKNPHHYFSELKVTYKTHKP